MPAKVQKAHYGWKAWEIMEGFKQRNDMKMSDSWVQKEQEGAGCKWLCQDSRSEIVSAFTG